MSDVKSDVKKVVLAYSGGLDTSVILKWLQDVYQCEVVTFTADIGQGEEVEPARAKALKMGIKKSNIFIEDLREEFVRDYVFPMFRANTVYEGEYLMKIFDFLMPIFSALARAGSTSSPWPISAVKVTTSHWYTSCNHLRMTEVSKPPE